MPRSDLPAERRGGLFGLSGNACMFKVKIHERSLEVSETRLPDSFAVVQAAQITDMELHGEPVGFQLSGRSADVAQAPEGEPGAAIIYLRFGHKPDAVAGEKNAAE